MQESIALTEATYYILLALYEPNHGYGIMQKVEKLSNGRLNLSPGTLYGALNTLMEKDWITMLPIESNSRKKEYQLTERGLKALKNEVRRLRELVENGNIILGGCDDEEDS